MAQRAGVAISRIAKGAAICITRVDGAPYGEGYFFKPVEYKLESDDPTEIMNMIKRLVTFDITLIDNGFSISYPLFTPWVKTNGFKCPSHDHFKAFVYGYCHTSTISEKGDHNDGLKVLFIDLTPGQSAFEFHTGVWNRRRWGLVRVGESRALGDAGHHSLQEVVDEIFKRAHSNEDSVKLIGIFRPEGQSPEVTAALEAQFPNTTIKWVSLADLSYGTAAVMHGEFTSLHQHTGSVNLPLPLGITLASGQTVTVMEQHCEIPRDKVVLFTNSRDNQRAATVRLVRGTLPGGVITVGGLLEKPRGETRIQVKTSASRWENTVVTVEELGSTARKVVSIPNIVTCVTIADVKVYESPKIPKQLKSMADANNVIGELPE